MKPLWRRGIAASVAVVAFGVLLMRTTVPDAQQLLQVRRARPARRSAAMASASPPTETGGGGTPGADGWPALSARAPVAVRAGAVGDPGPERALPTGATGCGRGRREAGRRHPARGAPRHRVVIGGRPVLLRTCVAPRHDRGPQRNREPRYIGMGNALTAAWHSSYASW